jgi:DNA-binding MarR family transcriptional regulator
MNRDEQNFYAARGQWLDYLATRRDFTHGDFRVAYFIASKINPRDGSMWWGVKTIADELGVGVGTVTAAIRRLDKARLLVITKVQHGSHRYQMRMPIDPEGDAYYAMPAKRKKTGGRKPRVSKTEIR